MDHVHWNAAQVEPSRQFDYYRSGLCQAFARLTPDSPEVRGRFAASLDIWSSDRHGFSVLSTQSHSVARTRRDLAAVPDDNLYLNVVLRGEMGLAQGDLAHRFGPGEMMLIDNARPFRVTIDAASGHRHLALRLDRRCFAGASAPGPRRLNRHPLAPALLGNLRALADSAGSDPAQLAAGAEAAACLVQAIARTDGARISNDADQVLTQVQALIEARFGDPDFALDEAAAALGRSRRSVQQHLHLSGTSFSRLLGARRLTHAHRQLATRAPGQSIEAIAQDAGYRELTTFYRAFKARFGKTPGAI